MRLLLTSIAFFSLVALSAQELRFDVTLDWQDEVVAPEGTTGGSLFGELKDTSVTETYQLGLGNDYFYLRYPSGYVRYHDCTNRLLYSFHEDSTSYTRVPTHASVDYLRSELANRQFLSGVLSAGGQADDLMGTDYDLGCAFGIAPSDTVLLEWTQKKNKLAGKVDGVERINIVLAKKPIDDAKARVFELFLRYELQLHPEAVTRIKVSGQPVSKATYDYTFNFAKRSCELEIAAQGDHPEKWDRVARFNASAIDQSTGTLRSQISAWLHRSFNNTEVLDYAEMARGFVADSNYCDAMLSIFELTLSDNDQPIELIREVVGNQQYDPLLAGLLTSLSTRDTSEAMLQAKLENLYAIRNHPDLERGAVVDIFIANTYEEAGKDFEAEKHFLSALEANPALAAPYHDLGMLYVRQYAFDVGWQCFDVGMQLNENHEIFLDTKQRTDALESDFPSFFLSR